jgi:hypothetical protein
MRQKLQNVYSHECKMPENGLEVTQKYSKSFIVIFYQVNCAKYSDNLSITLAGSYLILPLTKHLIT